MVVSLIHHRCELPIASKNRPYYLYVQPTVYSNCLFVKHVRDQERLLLRHLFLCVLGEIIRNVQELQNLTVDTSAEKEKQKADVKHILQQKQRALSDLFKMLTQIGRCHFSLLHRV